MLRLLWFCLLFFDVHFLVAHADDFLLLNFHHQHFTSSSEIQKVFTIDLKSTLLWQYGHHFSTKNLQIVSAQIMAKGNGAVNFLSPEIAGKSGPQQRIIGEPEDFYYQGDSTYRPYFFSSPSFQVGGAWFLKVVGTIRIKSILFTVRIAPEALASELQVRDLRYEVLGSGSGGRFFSRFGQFHPFPGFALKVKLLGIGESVQIVTVSITGSNGKTTLLTSGPFVLAVDQEKEFNLPEIGPIATINVEAKSLNIFRTKADSYQVEVGYDALY